MKLVVNEPLYPKIVLAANLGQGHGSFDVQVKKAVAHDAVAWHCPVNSKIKDSQEGQGNLSNKNNEGHRAEKSGLDHPVLHSSRLPFLIHLSLPRYRLMHSWQPVSLTHCRVSYPETAASILFSLGARIFAPRLPKLGKHYAKMDRMISSYHQIPLMHTYHLCHFRSPANATKMSPISSGI